MFELTPTEIVETVTFRDGGRQFRVQHVFRAPTFADWWEYERALHRTTEIIEGAVKFDRREEEAAEAFWNRVIVRTEGYRLRDGAEAAPEQIPLLHKMAGVRLLAQVFLDDAEVEDDEEAAFFDPDKVEIRLLAQRGGQVHNGLKHFLRRPTAREQKEFSRRTSGALFVAGSRTQKSIIPARLKDLVELYDRLVEAIEGYSVAGESETARPGGPACQVMDALHKQTVVQALFAPVE